MVIFQGIVGVVLFSGLDPSVIVAIISGIIVPLLGFIVTVVWRLHRRMLKLEKDSKSREKVVYGGEKNPLNLGLVKEIKSLKEEFKAYEDRQEELSNQNEEITERLKSLEDEKNIENEKNE